MIIRGIHIENFGHFHDFTLEFGPGLNKFRGDNEFGKSTLLEFVRRVLWGFPDRRKQQLNHYPARFAAGEYGGWLDAELADGRRVRLERFGVRGKLAVRLPDGSAADGDEFLKSLTPVSGDCYRRVYAITTDELSRLAELDGDEIRGRLYGGAITGEGVSLPELGKLLDDRAKALYKQRNGVSRINTAREELRAARVALEEAVNRSARRDELERELAELAEKERVLREESERLAAEAGTLKLLLEAYPLCSELRILEERLAKSPPPPEVPMEAAAAAEKLQLRLEAAERALPPHPEKSGEELELELARADAELEKLAVVDRMPPPRAEDYAAARALETKRPAPSSRIAPAPYLAAAALAAALAAAVVLAGTARWCAVATAVAAGYFVWRGAARLSRERRRAAEWRAQCTGFASKFGLVCPPEEFTTALALREQRERIASELRAVRDYRAARDAAEALRRDLRELCGRHGCAAAAELRERAGACAEHKKLQAELERSAGMLDALLGTAANELRARLRTFDPAAATERASELERKREELGRSAFLLHRQTGALTNELEHLPDGEELELRRTMVESARAEVAAAVREFLVVRSCRRLLDAAVDRYERESQPEVLKRAGELFSKFTAGRYPRLYRDLAAGELIVCDAETGLEKDFSALSRGTREELMIAMRLALIECTERGTEPLPVVFDDVGVNFDARRLAAVEAAAEEFARGRQIIWFRHA